MTTCALLIIINLTSVWNRTDQINLNQAKKRCITLYENAPCLNKFIKREERVYWAICGRE